VENEAAVMSVNHKNQVLNTVSLIRAESGGPATYFVVDKICDKLGIPVPSLRDVIKKLGEKRFQALVTHFHSRGIRTDAPAKTVIETTRNAK
jgi:tRNA G26 N,N-dimethylase Trm1